MNDNILQTDFFDLVYSKTWNYELIDNTTHTFYNSEGLGAFQISCYSKDKTLAPFNLSDEQREYKDSIIKKYGENEVIQWTSSTSINTHRIINWLIGKKHTILYCTYAISEIDIDKKDFKEELRRIHEILESIEIH